MSAALAILGAGLAGALGNVYSNSMNAANAAALNQKNADLQYALNLDNIEAARINNLTAVDLANTAHQREIRDLQDAGLNPILSATGGNGASTPSLTTPNLDAPTLQRADIVNPLANITSAVGQAMQYSDQHNLSQLQSKVLDSQLPYDLNVSKRLAEEEANSAISQARASKAQADYDSKLNDLKLQVLDLGLNKSYRDMYGAWEFEPRYKAHEIDPGSLGPLVKDSVLSDIKDNANKNWRNNAHTIFGGINSATSALGSLGRGMAVARKFGGFMPFFRHLIK